MDKNSIAKATQLLETKEDLLNLLNRIKSDKMAECGMSEKFYPFTMKHLNYYCNPNNSFHRYKQFKIKKKSGGFRQITTPRNHSYMLLLRYVNEIFKAVYIPSDYAMGFTEERSVVTNANMHKGYNYVFNIDLKDFFPSIHQARLWKRLQLKPLFFKQPIANIIAGLCSMKEKMEDGSVRYILPQGAPTSPIITNMICDKLDRRLAGLAKRFGVVYSRYADDITFSSMHNVYHPSGEFIKEIRRIVEGQGFVINEDKTRLQKLGTRQEVTGIIVSDKLNVSQKYVRNIRNILYIWRKYGYATAFNKFFPKYKETKGYVKKGNPDMVNVLDGKLMYLKMVKGENDSVYMKLKAQFDKLCNSLHNDARTTRQGVTYVETWSVLEFEHKNDTTISIITTKPKEFYTIQTKKEEIKKAEYRNIENFIPHRYASFKLGGRMQKASVNKSLKKEEENQKELLSISNCRDAKGKLFWLVHRSDKMIVPPVQPVDIDKLNDDLDKLLN
ncbi:reverse transcriptase family protein [uncultured Prevotella sp.]|uniref:reverse transcriptase family protein n=1 Tax=uncultured Prevotella sp. TaxID=159272 RepID=UPI0025F4A552|nr:reverse transcriptase family protein [uncultured Prevotella sp.]